MRQSVRALSWQTPSLLVSSQGPLLGPPKPLVASWAGVPIAPQFLTWPGPPCRQWVRAGACSTTKELM